MKELTGAGRAKQCNWKKPASRSINRIELQATLLTIKTRERSEAKRLSLAYVKATSEH
ncbi:hypothetical protein [Paraburkholderia metrosideri]|uniref:hypothetical protein n=1 Tax=Paraburkholderia metrosideri TaxID=580937 RepID=UPI0019194DEB|nr:hypothetical protein [Paraburkholderia metrosideri]